MLVFIYQFLDRLKTTPARKNKTIVISSILGLTLNILIWLIIYLKFYPLVYNLPEEQSFIPLHYNIYLGIDLFGPWQNIFYLPGIGLLIFLVNTISALLLYSKKEILSYFLSISSSLLQVFLLLATIFVILINI
jgi:Co/Zn/Cd efflux system component